MDGESRQQGRYCCALRRFDEVAQAWHDLYQAAPESSPFLAPAWHQALHELVAEIRDSDNTLAVVEVREEGLPVGLATLGWAYGRRLRHRRSRVLFLNETGEARFDRLTVEHNGLLTGGGREGEVLASLVSELLERDDWDELSLGWMAESHWQRLCGPLRGLPVSACYEERAPYYFVDLEEIANLEDYLQQLSANTRQQIRRALRKYGGEEQLSLEVASQPELAQAWLHEMISLHQVYWRRRGRSGAFADPFMREFHRRRIIAGLPNQEAQLLRIAGPEGVIGLLYNLAARDYLCNYQSGFVYDSDARRKPGLVSHALAVAHAGAAGFQRYDLLMGDSQYKRSLASGQGEMVRVVLQRRRWKLALYRQLHRLRELA